MQPCGQRHERNALVLYGSETGNAQEIAEEIGRTTERLHFSTRVAEMDESNLNDLLKYSVVLFALSTTGQGELPANARSFWKRLKNARLQPGCLNSLCFASFGLGDSSYPQFNWAHRKLYNRLRYLGAASICERGESDEQHPEGVEGCFLPWTSKVRHSLLDLYPLSENLHPIPENEFLVPKWSLRTRSDEEGRFGRDIDHGDDTDRGHESIASNNPSVKNRSRISAILTRNDRLTPPTHWQDVRLFEFSIPPTQYQPGDVLTVFPRNSAEDVDHLLSLMGWSPEADKPCYFKKTGSHSQPAYYPPPPLAMKDMTLRKLLTNCLDINAIPRRSFFGRIAHFTTDEMQKERLLEFTNPEYVDELYDYTTRPRRSIVEVLQEFDAVRIPFKWAANAFPVIRGRQFSIASGGELKRDQHGNGRVQLIVAIVKYKTVIKKIREGLCTKYLARLSQGTALDVVLCKGGMKHALNKPAVMVGPGTGIAPLRSMIYERAVIDQCGSTAPHTNLLFFGGRNRSADFFFEDEWPRLQDAVGLEVCTAFSRDQKAKLYVQDRIRERAQAVYDALRTGSVYVCGSSGKMPLAVREALVDVFQDAGGMQRAAAETRLSEMEKDGRYQQETW